MTGDADPCIGPARLFARLLLRELDAETLDELRQPEVAAALAEMSIEVPEAEHLDELGAQFFEMILQPKGHPPLVQSLWNDGKYDGDATVAVRQIAEAAGFELGAGARKAPVDHLGCLLSLWSELREQGSDWAEPFAQNHLAWVEHSSAPTAPEDRFYGSVLRATAALVAEICAND